MIAKIRLWGEVITYPQNLMTLYAKNVNTTPEYDDMDISIIGLVLTMRLKYYEFGTIIETCKPKIALYPIIVVNIHKKWSD